MNKMDLQSPPKILPNCAVTTKTKGTGMGSNRKPNNTISNKKNL